MPANKAAITHVYLEVAAKRQFASALEWPGWCRSGKDEQSALAALEAAAPRYAAVAKAAGLPFSSDDVVRFEVVERVKGSATTDFGAPGAAAFADSKPLKAGEADRLIALLQAAWKYLDRVVAKAPAELRKGPRGGGRDRDDVYDHVLGAESMYATKIGIRLAQPRHDDTAGIAGFRKAFVEGLRAAGGRQLGEKQWPFRYAVRRVTWHVLDHAWEIEDRSEP
jgi:hypothetical protein